MKVKFLFSTESMDLEYWTNLPFIPHLKEWFNVQDMLNTQDLAKVIKSANCWSGERGLVQSVEYRFDGTDFFSEIIVWCED